MTFIKEPLPGPEVIKLEFILKLKIKLNDWLLGDTCPQAANYCALFEFETRGKVFQFCDDNRLAY